MRIKEFEFFSVITKDYSSEARWQRRLGKWWEKWGKAVLVAALFILGILWWNALTPEKYTRDEMKNYAVFYLNQVK